MHAKMSDKTDGRTDKDERKILVCTLLKYLKIYIYI